MCNRVCEWHMYMKLCSFYIGVAIVYNSSTSLSQVNSTPCISGSIMVPGNNKGYGSQKLLEVHSLS